ncbi:hypothetical protein DQ04_02771020 [Trypanosoma grayi]|uniref:hypothetical protein n=1 Tax=Trypanosoma grayi TaxID=71804 RepID=UPI0004F48902|nr:hypothetical protein DQ04_02771020 [Trypanosoma grayi]KEG11288.1 hypothetical protein DQ04_02771020 [Trypanosoma grayi]
MEPQHHGDDSIELEVIGADGRPIIRHPIDVNELLRRKGNTIELEDGIHVRLEEYCEEDASYSESEEDEEEEEEEEEDEEEQGGESDESIDATSGTHAPPGYRGLTNWDDALNAVRSGESAAATKSRSRSLERSHRSERHINSGIGTTGSSGGVGTQRSRHDVWASFATPVDPDRNYKRLQSTSLMPSATSRRFRLPPLMYHATASYLGPADQGQRILVYGGTTNIGKTVEKELYEFSLLTGNWRRLEGKQYVSPGNYGHTALVVESLHRLVVIGGVGPDGRPVSSETLSDAMCKSRYHLLFPCKSNAKTKRAALSQGTLIEAEKPTLWTLAHRMEEESAIGFVSILFDMDLKTHRWRAIQTTPEIPVAFHTAVVNRSNIYIFGGVTNQLLVSAQLIVIDAQTYRVTLIPSNGAAPKARYLHSAVVYGQWIVIYGGFDVQNEPLDDAWAFDMVNERWEQLECHGSPSRGAHAACIVGSRLIIVGGLESAITVEQSPTSSIFELQLVPTLSGKYLWKKLLVRPAVPPLVFAAASACADDASFIVYGGCTPVVKSTARKSKQHQQPQGAAKRPVPCKPNSSADYDNDSGDDGNNFWRKLAPFSDGFAFTFPLKKVVTASPHEDTAPHVNALGVMVDPEELSPEFQAFVRRQQDFLLKKNAARAQEMKKISLDELENMEPHLYLKPEEIEMLLTKSNELCDTFTEYNMESLPHNTPDRATRLHLSEECVSLSRQLRDVLKSMKGYEPGVTAVKSKTHRMKSGRKFEDHSAAKPFRRVVVMNLVKEANKNLKRVHVMNKALKTVEWPEKVEYIEAVRKMQLRVDEFVQTVKSILEKYIELRVESLMSAVEKRKDKMRRLAEIVSKVRHDKIFDKDEPDPQRERVKQMWEKGEVRSAVKEGSHRSTSQHCRRRRSRSTGAGYYKDEEKAFIALQPKELAHLLEKACIVKKASKSFGDYCRSTMSTAQNLVEQTHQEQQQQQQQSQVSTVATVSVSGSQSLNVPVVLGVPTLPPPISPPQPPPQQQQTEITAELGTASPSALVRQHSDKLRQMGAEQAERVRECIRDFAKVLEDRPVVEGVPDVPRDSETATGKETLLCLSTLRSLIASKEKLEKFKEKVPSIRINQWAEDSLAGAPQDEEAQKRFVHLMRSLSALVQRLTMSFLTKAGSRPSRNAVHTRGKSAAVPLRPPSDPARAPSSRSKSQRRVIRVTHMSTAVDSMVPQGGDDVDSRLKQQEEEQHVIAFVPLVTPPVYADASITPPSVVVQEVSKPISLTSGEAMTLVPGLPTTSTNSGDRIIVPSSSDIKVIPNTHPYSSPRMSYTDHSTMTVAAGDGLPLPPPISRPVVCESLSPSPLTRISVSQGPHITTASTAAELPSFHDSLAATQTRMNVEAEWHGPTGMVSFSPGFFHSNGAPHTTGSDKTAFSAAPRNAADTEDDYFFFGRRFAAETDVAPCAAAGTTPWQAFKAVEPQVMSGGTHAVTVSPPVGTNAGLASGAPKTKLMCPLPSRRSHVPSAVVEVVTRSAGGGMFRGKLTPGEAQILKGRERLRAESSRRNTEKKHKASAHS